MHNNNNFIYIMIYNYSLKSGFLILTTIRVIYLFYFDQKVTDPVVCHYYGVQKSRRWKGKREGGDYSSRPIKLAGKVIIQEISCLLPVHKALGETYVYVMFSLKCIPGHI